jgi:DNA-directed RNA polymerase subunit alpha
MQKELKETAWVKYTGEAGNYGTFVAEPLERGFGTTLGNSLRRVLLSSLPGAAVTSVKIEGADHEFGTLPGIKEDIIDILMNIKGLVVNSHSNEPKTIKLQAKGEGVIMARDIEHDAEVEIINPEHKIATLARGGKLNIEMQVEKGKGFLPAEMNKKPDHAIGTIPLDAIFSPVIKVNHSVESIRVGKFIDYDKLILEVWTNGSIAPDDAVKASTDILKNRLDIFLALNKKPESKKEAVGSETEKKKVGLDMSIEDLELSARSSNCLKKAGINTVAQLIEKPIEELMAIKNFGRKSAEEINAKLANYGLSLKEKKE